MPDDAWEALAAEIDAVPVGNGAGWFGRYLLADVDQARRLAARAHGTVCTISLWGAEWWCHEGTRTVQPVGYLVGRRVPAAFHRRLPEPDE